MYSTNNYRRGGLVNNGDETIRYESDNVYYNFTIRNDTANEVFCEQRDVSSQPWLTKANDYSCSVLKFNLPLESIQSYIINSDNQNEYKIKVSSYAAVANKTFKEFYGEESLPTNSQFSYLNSESMIEAINRTSISSHEKYYASFNTDFNNVKTVGGTFTFSEGTNKYHEETINITPNAGNSDRIGYIQVKLNVGYAGTEVSPNENEIHPHTCYLVTPGGKEVLLYANSLTNINNQMVFEEKSYDSIDKVQKNIEIPANVYHTREPMVALFADDVSYSGNWKLKFVTNQFQPVSVHPFHLDGSYEINVYYCPSDLKIQRVPTVVRVLNDKIEALFHEQAYLGNNQFKLSSRLNNMLQFESTYDTVDNYYRVIYPQANLSNTFNSYVVLQQPVSSVFRLINISQLQIRSNNLPFNGERDSSSKDRILLSIDYTLTEKESVSFLNEIEKRIADLTGSDDLYSLQLSVWVVYNDLPQPVLIRLPPYSTFTALLQFVRKQHY